MVYLKSRIYINPLSANVQLTNHLRVVHMEDGIWNWPF